MGNINPAEYISMNGLCKNIDDEIGIYAIIMNDDQVLYVGQAKKMRTRVTTHFDHALNNRGRYKYTLLHEAINHGNRIDCVRLDICKANQLNSLEKFYIAKYKINRRKYPPLNFLFFKNEDNYSYDDFIKDLDVYTPLASSEPVSIEPDQIELVDKP